jgi:uncharacterized membrane protein YoaK (UPF0700 family)
VPTSTRLGDTCLSFGLAFVGGYGDAASFVLAKTFTGHVTGNLVLGAIAVAAQDWRAVLGHLTAIVTFLLGVVLKRIFSWVADCRSASGGMDPSLRFKRE